MNNKKFGKIQPPKYFEQGTEFYFLLPFRFHKISYTKEVIVNEVGDFLICDIDTSRKIANREIHQNDPLYPDLVSNFIIYHKPIPELIDILATRYRTKKAFLDSFTSLHIIVVTLRCDNKCIYCQVNRKSEDQVDYDISFEILDKIIELIFRSPAKDLTIEFQGGEPLLAFDKVRYVVKKINETNATNKRNISFVLCTNLTYLTQDVLDFCKQYELLISTSLDGPEYLHNANRPSPNFNSFKRVTTNIRKCRETLGYDKVSALMTTTELSLDYPKEIIDEYLKQGFRNIFLRAINPYGLSKTTRLNEQDYINRFLEFYKTALTYIIELNLNGTYFVEDYACIILTKILTPFSICFTDLQSPSGIITGVAVYNYDGYVYASDESRMLAEEKDYTFRLGHIQKNNYEGIFYGEKTQYISQSFANEFLSGCSECAFLSYCGADPVRNYTMQGDMTGFRPTNTFCKKNMEIIRFLFELMSENKEIKKIFLSWVNRIFL